MSVACGSWEVASGPMVGCKPVAQVVHCGTEGPNFIVHTQQESLIRGLSALSLYVQSHSEAEPYLFNNKDDNQVFLQGKPESLQSMSQAGYSTAAGQLIFLDHSQHLANFTENGFEKSRFTSVAVANPMSPPNAEFSRENDTQVHPHKIDTVSSSCYRHLPALDVVSEDNPWESTSACAEIAEGDAISSCSSVSDMRDDIICASDDGSHCALEDLEVQSADKGPGKGPTLLEAPLPVKKGLSRFYSGKSRSFTCLADVVSVKDLAKPENPYSRKRKSFAAYSGTLDRPRFCPLRNGAGIAKKPLHNNRSTLALAVAMSSTEGIVDGVDQEFEIPTGVCTWWKSSSAPSRSSLLDLQ
eukprot:c27976_g1_i1 orf=678-1745(+)